MTAQLTIFLQWFFLLFIGASFAKKIFRPRIFLRVLADYQLVPRALLPLFAPLVVAAEAMVLILLAHEPIHGGLGVALLLTLYSIGIAINLYRDRDHFDCGCFWRVMPTTQQRNAIRHIPWLACRNGVAVAAALGLSVAASSHHAATEFLFLEVNSLHHAAAATFFILLVVLLENFISMVDMSRERIHA